MPVKLLFHLLKQLIVEDEAVVHLFSVFVKETNDDV
jgi:hypothetical protein